MNNGTKIRTALRVAVSFNTAVYAVQGAIGNLHYGTLTAIWAVLTIVSDFLVAGITTYYNNDFTESACIGTGITRQMKAESDPDYKGERFYTEEVKEDE